jgi:hypothetical protein
VREENAEELETKIVSIARPGTGPHERKVLVEICRRRYRARFGSARGASLNTTLHQLMTFFEPATLLRYEDRNSMRFPSNLVHRLRTTESSSKRYLRSPLPTKSTRIQQVAFTRGHEKTFSPKPIYSRTTRSFRKRRRRNAHA